MVNGNGNEGRRHSHVFGSEKTDCTAADFHRLCEDQGATLTSCDVSEQERFHRIFYVFGGFHSLAWDSIERNLLMQVLTWDLDFSAENEYSFFLLFFVDPCTSCSPLSSFVVPHTGLPASVVSATDSFLKKEKE